MRTLLEALYVGVNEANGIPEPEFVTEIREEVEASKIHQTRSFERVGRIFKEKLAAVWEDLEKPGYPPCGL